MSLRHSVIRKKQMVVGVIGLDRARYDSKCLDVFFAMKERRELMQHHLWVVLAYEFFS